MRAMGVAAHWSRPWAAPTCRCYARPSQPYCIPIRVILHPFHQPGTHRVGNHITCGAQQVFLGAQGVIVKSPCPQRVMPAQYPVGAARTRRFQAADQGAQAIGLAQLDQPMRVIGYQHPCQHAGVAQDTRVFEAACSGTSHGEFTEQGLPSLRDGGDQVRVVWQRYSPSPQGVVSGMRANRWGECMLQHDVSDRARGALLRGRIAG